MTTRRNKLLALLAISAFAGLGLGGCNNQKRAQEIELGQLRDENTQLRDENDKSNASLTSAQQRLTELEGENATLKTNPSTGGGSMSGGGGSDRDRVMTVAGDVAFGPGQVTLTAAGKREVDKIVSEISSQYSGHRIEIAGYTDRDPLKKTKDKYTDNENLSAQRALAVERYMNSKGISADQTHVTAYGPANPKGNKKDSRRVEIRVMAN